MYINRQPEEIFKAANLAVSIQLFDNLINTTIKDVAREFLVSEKQLHNWKRRLIEEGPNLFSSLKPGRKKEEWTSLDENERLLILETINNLLTEGKRYENRNQKFSPEFKEKILKERDNLKEENALTYEDFYRLMGISPRSVRDWAEELREEGPEGLKDKARAPNTSPKKLTDEIIKEILKAGTKWKRRYGRIKLVEFGTHFRWEYRRLLSGHGRSNLSDKTIGRYLPVCRQAGKIQGFIRKRKKGQREREGHSGIIFLVHRC